MNDSIKVFKTQEELYKKLSYSISSLISETLVTQKIFSFVVSGGNSPKKLFEHLCQEQIEWKKVHFFWSDERYVPHTDPESNYFLANEFLFKHIEIPKENIHAIPTDEKDPLISAQKYEKELNTVFNDKVEFDLTLLGLGEDGHTASLFPDSPQLEETDSLVTAVFDSPKPPATRISLTFKALNSSKAIYFLVTGKGKAEAVKKVLESGEPVHLYPAKGIGIQNSQWWLDQEAGNLLLFKFKNSPGVRKL